MANKPAKGAKIFTVALMAIVALVIVGLVNKQPEQSTIMQDVQQSLDKLDSGAKQALVSAGGLQGDIEKVEADGADGIKVHVTTNYSKTGSEEDGGQNIARKILGAVCFDVPKLKSVYVTSTTSGLDSRSVYRSDIPACTTE